jgi:hypothetical protein
MARADVCRLDAADALRFAVQFYAPLARAFPASGPSTGGVALSIVTPDVPDAESVAVGDVSVFLSGARADVLAVRAQPSAASGAPRPLSELNVSVLTPRAYSPGSAEGTIVIRELVRHFDYDVEPVPELLSIDAVPAERCRFYDAPDCALHLRIRELLGLSDPSDTAVLFGADQATVRSVRQLPQPLGGDSGEATPNRTEPLLELVIARPPGGANWTVGVTVAHVRAGESEVAQLVFDYQYPLEAAPPTAAPKQALPPAGATQAATTALPSLRLAAAAAAAGGANVSTVPPTSDGSAGSNRTETYAKDLAASIGGLATSIPVRRRSAPGELRCTRQPAAACTLCACCILNLSLYAILDFLRRGLEPPPPPPPPQPLPPPAVECRLT